MVRVHRATDVALVFHPFGRLPKTWRKADGGTGRKLLAGGLFERIEVLGLRRMRMAPTDAAVARGLAEAFSSASAGYGRTHGLDPAHVSQPMPS
jgi:hypothetical protein